MLTVHAASHYLLQRLQDSIGCADASGTNISHAAWMLCVVGMQQGANLRSP
jgi:hypothetical protein